MNQSKPPTPPTDLTTHRITIKQMREMIEAMTYVNDNTICELVEANGWDYWDWLVKEQDEKQ